MNEDTINALGTMTSGAKPLLAGRYRPLNALGQGGMGSVWLAEDTTLDNHKVAIKMLPSIFLSDRRALQQVKGEALVSLRLSHPNIVTLRSFEENDGNPFLVMDFIDGRTLGDYLAEKGTLSEDEVLRTLKPVADAIDYAHGQGVVHRDVKPGNVMIASDGKPYILDFGIAREVQETMTRVTGKFSSGTLMYMSPEQLGGAKPTPAQDVYSFAAMVYECLVGHTPFCRGQIEWQILNAQPEPLSAEIGIGKGVMAGLAKDPAARPDTCGGVLSNVSKDAARSSKRMAWAVILFLLAALVGVGGWWWFAHGNVHKKNVASVNVVNPTNEIKAVVLPVRPATNVVKNASAPATNEVKVVVQPVRPATNVVKNVSAPATNVVVVKPPSKPTPDELAKAGAEKMQEEISGIRNGVSEVERQMASDELQNAEQQYDQGMKSFASGKYVAATNAWTQALDDYATMRNVAKKRQEQARQLEQEREERKKLRVQLAQGSRFYPNPPQREAGTSGTITLPNGSRMKMIWCPPGRFLMGSPESESRRQSGEVQHLVTLTKGFWIGRCEVTRDEWKAVMGSSGSMLTSLFGIGGQVPVDEVSWLQCQEFCRRLSKCLGHEVRLPTEAEWEYACRAGTATPFSFGSALNGDRACCAGGEPYGTSTPGANSYTGAATVGSYGGNPWGICDMHGNVFEWCWDYYADYPEEDVVNPRGPDSGRSRVRRGGCWNFSPHMCRSAFRSQEDPGKKASFTGFRICCDKLE